METTPEDRRIRCARCGTDLSGANRECAACGFELVADAARRGASPEGAEPRAGIAESGARPDSFATRVAATIVMGLVAMVSLGLGIWMSLDRHPTSAARSRVESNVRLIASQIEARRKETGRYPDAALWQSWVAPGTAPFIDPWGRPYDYRLQSDGYAVSTNGADGEPRGSGENEDLTFGFRDSIEEGAPPP